MKILLIANQAKSTYNFWSVLISHIQQAGHELVCCVPHEKNCQYIDLLKSNNIKVITYSLKRNTISPWQDVKTIVKLCRIFQQEQPHQIFTFAIKPVIYANIAAKLTGITAYSCITGLGLSFEQSKSIFRKCLHNIVTLLYKISLHNSAGIIFQNQNDKQVFLQKNIIQSNANTLLCNGTGVNTKHFYMQTDFPKAITFLLIARLLKAKGISEFAHAAKILKAKYSNINFQLLGPAEQGLGALSLQQVMEWQQLGYIKYLGEAHDVRQFISESSVVVLPSYREGLSCSLMEAMSMGRPIVASRVPGCMELIHENKNGFLVKAKDEITLANALEKFIINPQLIVTMGSHSRHMAEKSFDANIVALQIMQFMHL